MLLFELCKGWSPTAWWYIMLYTIYIQQEDHVGLCFLFGKNVQKPPWMDILMTKKSELKLSNFDKWVPQTKQDSNLRKLLSYNLTSSLNWVIPLLDYPPWQNWKKRSPDVRDPAKTKLGHFNMKVLIWSSPPWPRASLLHFPQGPFQSNPPRAFLVHCISQ